MYINALNLFYADFVYLLFFTKIEYVDVYAERPSIAF